MRDAGHHAAPLHVTDAPLDPTLLHGRSRRVNLTATGVDFSPAEIGNLSSSPLALVFAALGFDDQVYQAQPLPIDLTPLGFTNCSLRIAPQAIEVLSNIAGVADWNLTVPADPVLDGVVFYVQGMVGAPAFNPASAVLSNSGRGVAGAL